MTKEKLFPCPGLDVLDQFLTVLRAATKDAPDGYSAAIAFCRDYLEFSIDKNSNWLVLVRCSPYSDMKTKTDRDQMNEMFEAVPKVLEAELIRGMADGSVRQLHPADTAQVIISLMVGVNAPVCSRPMLHLNYIWKRLTCFPFHSSDKIIICSTLTKVELFCYFLVKGSNHEQGILFFFYVLLLPRRPEAPGYDALCLT